MLLKQKKSDFLSQTMYDLRRICRKDISQFLPCTIGENKESEELELVFDTQTKESAEILVDRSNKEKFQFMLSVLQLKELFTLYDFSLNPKNLYIDFNRNVFVCYRMIRKENPLINEKFLNESKSLFAYFFLNKSYEEILHGGTSLWKEHLLVKEIIDKNEEEFYQYVVNLLTKEIEVEKINIQVPKQKQKRFKLLFYFFVLTTIFLSLIAVYLYAFVISDKNREINAVGGYFDLNYPEVISILNDVQLDDLNKNELFVLAISYIKTSNLNSDSISVASSNIGRSGDLEYSKFWVCLGRGEFELAYEIADKYLDKRLLFFAYSVELNSYRPIIF